MPSPAKLWLPACPGLPISWQVQPRRGTGARPAHRLVGLDRAAQRIIGVGVGAGEGRRAGPCAAPEDLGGQMPQPIAKGRAIVRIGDVGAARCAAVVAPDRPVEPVVAGVGRPRAARRLRQARPTARVGLLRQVAVAVIAEAGQPAIRVGGAGHMPGGVIGRRRRADAIGLQGLRHAAQVVVGGLRRAIDGIGCRAVAAVALGIDRATKGVAQAALLVAVRVGRQRLLVAGAVARPRRVTDNRIGDVADVRERILCLYHAPQAVIARERAILRAIGNRVGGGMPAGPV